MADQASELVRSAPIRAEIAGNRLELIESGEERFRMLLELIATAQSSIKMLMYMFNPDRDGDAIRHFWSSELLYAPTDLGPEPRHVGTLEPLWNLFDLTPDGRPVGWVEQFSYD